jgi:hypothetical protein
VKWFWRSPATWFCSCSTADSCSRGRRVVRDSVGGRCPGSIFDFVVGVRGWTNRVSAYAFLAHHGPVPVPAGAVARRATARHASKSITTERKESFFQAAPAGQEPRLAPLPRQAGSRGTNTFVVRRRSACAKTLRRQRRATGVSTAAIRQGCSAGPLSASVHRSVKVVSRVWLPARTAPVSRSS